MNKKEKTLDLLTVLEYKVMLNFMDGKNYKQISTKLNISRQTVRNKIYSVVKKLNANNPIHSAAILAEILYLD